MATATEILGRARDAEQRGKLDEAARFYAKVVAHEPRNFEALHGSGVICFRAGDIAGAERWITRAIEANPRSAHAHCNLGTVYFNSGRLDLAITHYRAALSIAHDYVDARSNLAAALTEKGDLPEARTEYEAVLEAVPTHPEANNNLGAVLQRMGLDGTPYFERALQAKPDFVDALHNFGTACLGKGDFDRTIALCGKAARLRPGFVEAHMCAATALMRRERYREAIQHYRMIIRHRPDWAIAYNDLGLAVDAAGDPQRALAHLNKAIALDGTYVDPHVNLGIICVREGQLEESRREFEHALRLAPQDPRILFLLAGVKRFGLGDPELAAMERFANDRGLDENTRVQLIFALAKTYEDMGRFDWAAECLSKGNVLKRQRIGYDEKRTLDELLHVQQAFTPALLRRYANVGDPSDVPIFIVGMPRSGTTLIEQILASHDRVFGAGELGFLGEAVLNLPKRMGGISADFPDYIAAMDEKWPAQLAQEYLRAIKPIAPAASRITDKMPSNFRFVGLIHLAFPNACIIHARRDPVDTCLSCYSTLFSEGQAFAYDLRELGRLYNGYDRLMSHWHRVLPAGVMLDVQYEKLVADFENEARRLVAYCGLDWSNACLRFHETRRAVRTASAMQVRRPLYSTSVGRWRAYERMLEPLLDELGSTAASMPV